MNSLHRILIAGGFTLIFLLVYAVSPRSGIALKPLDDAGMLKNSPSTQIASVKPDENLAPLDDQALDVLSPTTTEKMPAPVSSGEHSAILKAEFDSAVCFKKCHRRDDFSPSDKTRKQWQRLIENNGHDIFERISWENPQKKEYVLIYLYENARNPDFKAEGVGVWKP